MEDLLKCIQVVLRSQTSYDDLIYESLNSFFTAYQNFYPNVENDEKIKSIFSMLALAKSNNDNKLAALQLIDSCLRNNVILITIPAQELMIHREIIPEMRIFIGNQDFIEQDIDIPLPIDSTLEITYSENQMIGAVFSDDDDFSCFFTLLKDIQKIFINKIFVVDDGLNIKITKFNTKRCVAIINENIKKISSKKGFVIPDVLEIFYNEYWQIKPLCSQI